MKLYFAIWSIILMLPMPIRSLVEMCLILMLLALIWPIIKYVFLAVFKCLTFLNRCLLGGVRHILTILLHNHEKIYDLDEKIGLTGRKIDNWLNKKGESIRKSKCKTILKNKGVLIVLGMVFVAAILPYFKLETIVSEYYLENIYCVNRAFVGIERTLTQGIEEYPDLFKEVDKNQEGVVDETEILKPIYLKLSDDVSYANVRMEASMDSRSISIVSKEDQIAYYNIYKYDEKRCWLQVTVESQDNIEGWISSKVISKEIMDTINLN